MSKIIKEKKFLTFGNFQENEPVRIVWKGEKFRDFPKMDDDKKIPLYPGETAVFYSYIYSDGRCIVTVNNEKIITGSSMLIPENYYQEWLNGDFSIW